MHPLRARGRSARKSGYSIFIRSVCGILGILGLAAIGFEAVHDAGIQPGFMLFVKLWACFIFLYVALFAASPLETMSGHDQDNPG